MMFNSKLDKFSKKASDLPDVPSENMAPNEIKAYFDTGPEELRVKHNELVDELNNTTKWTESTGDHKGSWRGLTPQMIGAPEMNSARITAAEEQLADIAINVKSYGTKGNANYFNSTDGRWYEDTAFTILANDDTQAIKNAFSTGKNIYFPKGRYLFNIPNTTRNSLHWFTEENNIQINGQDAVLVDGNTYTEGKMVNVLAFTRCKNIKIIGLNYEGKAITNPDTELHVLGTTFAYFEDHCENIEVEADLNNMRYGVRTGDYLNPTYGYCKNFTLRITGEMIGYPIALYLADSVRSFVNVDGCHRATYLAGVYNADIEINSKNYYGATVQCLMTNTITTYDTVQSNQRARGCKNIKVKARDTGSTHYLPHTMMAGIGLQWVAQGTEFSDIDVLFSVRSDDTKASQIGGFQIASTAKDTSSTDRNYPFNWEPYITIKNVKASGTIDRTGQTVATNQAGELYIVAYDSSDTTYTHCPLISNLVIDNVVISKGTTQSRALYIEVPNLQDTLQINNLQADGIDTIMAARTGKVVLSNSKIKALSVSSLIADLRLDNSFINGLDNTKISKVSVNNINLGLTNSSSGVRQITVTTNGSMTYTVSGALKSTSLTKAIVGVLPGYTASGSWKMGTAADPALYGTAPLNSSNGYNRFSPFYFNQTAFPLYSNQNLVITFESATTIPSGLSIQIFIYEEEFIVN